MTSRGRLNPTFKGRPWEDDSGRPYDVGGGRPGDVGGARPRDVLGTNICRLGCIFFHKYFFPALLVAVA